MLAGIVIFICGKQIGITISHRQKEEISSNNRWGWGTAGALSGATLAGPAGFIVGAIAGALLGNSIEPE
jgi:hypothetical protein